MVLSFLLIVLSDWLKLSLIEICKPLRSNLVPLAALLSLILALLKISVSLSVTYNVSVLSLLFIVSEKIFSVLKGHDVSSWSLRDNGLVFCEVFLQQKVSISERSKDGFTSFPLK